MNSWGRAREVEKVKKPTVTERHAQLRDEATKVNARLGGTHKAIETISGRNSEAYHALLAAADLINRMADELRRAKS